jgi:hypothetical protein
MTYSYTADIPAPIEMYDAMHAAIKEAVGTSADGLLVHIGRGTESGFQVTEVWESKDKFDKFVNEIAGPIMARLSGGQAPPGLPTNEFELRGLVIQTGDIFV